MKTAVAIAALFAFAGCASSESQRSYVPKVQVVMKTPKARAAQANYQAGPEDSRLTGSGGSAK
jgi:hypothetical protein